MARRGQEYSWITNRYKLQLCCLILAAELPESGVVPPEKPWVLPDISQASFHTHCLLLDHRRVTLAVPWWERLSMKCPSWCSSGIFTSPEVRVSATEEAISDMTDGDRDCQDG